MISASIHQVAAQKSRWDVAVIGAGIAGTIAARQAALCGLKTVLIERRAVPHSKTCGGCLNTRALRVLSKIGLADVVARLCGETLHGMRLRWGAAIGQIDFPVGVAITRRSLDAALLIAAGSAGVEVITEASAVVNSSTDSFRQLLIHRHEQVEELRAKVVICADGLSRSSLRELPEMKATPCSDSRLGLGTVIARGVLPPSVTEQFPHSQITMVVGRSGYVGATWAERGQLSIAAAVDPHFLKSANSPGAAVSQILAESSIRLPECAGWHGTPPLTMVPHRNSAERLFVIGDAAGYIEPFTGEGMSAAMEEAISIIPLIVQAANEWRSSLAAEWQRQHQRHFSRRQRVCQLAAAILRRPWMSKLALQIVGTFPELADYLVGRVMQPSAFFK